MAKSTKRSANICLDAPAVQHCVSYALSQIRRLEAAGEFPKRIRLGDNRIGWSFREILDWMQSKVDARPVGPVSPKVTIDESDRFIRPKEVRSLVLYHPEHLRRLEHQGKFPGRIRLSDNCVVWLEREVREWLEAHRKQDKADAAQTYHVRLCRPRFEVATVTVKADNPGTAERTALELANVSKSGWHLLPNDPEIYQPHVEISVLEETPTYSAEAVQDILARYSGSHVRYLTLLADTNRGEGTALFQPWLTDQALNRAARDFPSGWIESIARDLKLVDHHGRHHKAASDRSR